MHECACAHTVEDQDNYTCHKPECVMKRVELEETNQLITKEMEWTYAESFKNAKESLTAEMLQKEEEETTHAREEAKHTQHKEVECSGHPNNPYMTLQEFNKYDLDNPLGLVSQFWIQHPDIAVNMMIHYVISGYTVLIPYKWHPSAFTHCNVYRPKEAKPEEKYVPLTMFDHIDMCRKWGAKPNQKRYPKLKEKESDRKYTPVIADARLAVWTFTIRLFITLSSSYWIKCPDMSRAVESSDLSVLNVTSATEKAGFDFLFCWSARDGRVATLSWLFCVCDSFGMVIVLGKALIVL